MDKKNSKHQFDNKKQIASWLLEQTKQSNVFHAILDRTGQGIQFQWGDPERNKITVANYTAVGADKTIYTNRESAIEAFLALL
jgi:hypothetical protein